MARGDGQARRPGGPFGGAPAAAASAGPKFPPTVVNDVIRSLFTLLRIHYYPFLSVTPASTGQIKICKHLNSTWLADHEPEFALELLVCPSDLGLSPE